MITEQPDTFTFTLPQVAPRLWIREFVLFGNVEDNKPIRRIKLRPGLNIIQGIDKISTPTKKQRNGVGHGVGKTLLCRMIRYLFGERTFGKQLAMTEVSTNFPHGYVGAVVNVAGNDWCIVRSFNGSFHRASQGTDYLRLSRAPEEPPLPPEQFLEALALLFVDRENPGPPPEWPALLAWCSRDQEARHKQLLQWRIADSQSHVTVDRDLALRTIRAVLGVGGHMREKEHERARAQVRVEQLDDEIKKWREKLERQRDREARGVAMLVPDLGEAVSSDEGLFDAEKQSEDRRAKLQEELAEVRSRIDALLPQIDEARRQKSQVEARRRNLSEAIKMAREKPTIFSKPDDGGVDPEDPCDYGQVKFKSCTHRQAFVEKLRREAEEQQRTGSSTSGADLGQAEQDVVVLAAQVATADEALQALNQQREALYAEQGRLRSERQQLEERSVSHSRIRHRLSFPDDDEQCAPLRAERNKLSETVARLTSELDNLTEVQTEHVRRFGELIDWIAKRIIGEEMTCKVSLTSTTLGVALVEGDGGEAGGEHYGTTMKVLLLDLAGMLSGAAGWSLHPGVLLHDSPKEAEMQDSLFQGLLSLLASLVADKVEDTSFQYIIVTSARTPTKLKPYVREELWRGGDGQGFLFRRRLTIPQTADMLVAEEVTHAVG